MPTPVYIDNTNPLYWVFIAVVGMVGVLAFGGASGYLNIHPVFGILIGIATAGGTWLVLRFVPSIASGVVFSVALSIISLSIAMGKTKDVLWIGFWTVVGMLIGFGIGWYFSEFAKGRRIYE
jgi:MFS family permease